MNLLFMANMAATLFLTGLIWIVQVVHYPSFAFVAAEKLSEFSQFHQNAITWVVAPVMIFELITSTLLYFQATSDFKLLALFLIVVLVWGSTFFLSVPIHNQLLSKGHDQQLISKLVLTNWPRTLLWTLKSIAMLYLVRSYV